MDVEVVDVRKCLGDGSLKAFANIKITSGHSDCSLTIKGVRVMRGKAGLFVVMPAKAGKDGKWYEMITADEALKPIIETEVLKAYDMEFDEEPSKVKPSNLQSAINETVERLKT